MLLKQYMGPALFQKGSRLGSSEDEQRWVVARKLGEGQFAEVYEVKDAQSRDRDVRVRNCLRRCAALCRTICAAINQ